MLWHYVYNSQKKITSLRNPPAEEKKKTDEDAG